MIKLGLKLVIMQKDHHNRVIRVSKKERIGEYQVRKGDETFFIDDDSFQITYERRFGMKRGYVTYYYAAGQVKPLPAPHFNIEEGKSLSDELQVTREELNAIFNPWFYKVISAKTMSPMERLQFFATVGTLLVAVYIAYTVSGIPEAVVNGVADCMQDPLSACNAEPPQPASTAPAAPPGATYNPPQGGA